MAVWYCNLTILCCAATQMGYIHKAGKLAFAKKPLIVFARIQKFEYVLYVLEPFCINFYSIDNF